MNIKILQNRISAFDVCDLLWGVTQLIGMPLGFKKTLNKKSPQKCNEDFFFGKKIVL
jgi:hypothetical protein